MATMAELADSILLAADTIPSGSVSTYGDVARIVGCGPRLVARVMSTSGGEVCWWRVVHADGTITPQLLAEAAARLAEEGVPTPGGRVDLARYRAELG